MLHACPPRWRRYSWSGWSSGSRFEGIFCGAWGQRGCGDVCKVCSQARFTQRTPWIASTFTSCRPAPSRGWRGRRWRGGDDGEWATPCPAPALDGAARSGGAGAKPGRSVDRAPDEIDEEICTERRKGAARREDDRAAARRVNAEDESRRHRREADVGEPPVHARARRSVQWEAGEVRDDVVGDAEDHHRDEAEEHHVHVREAVERPHRVRRHRDAEGDAEREPREAGFEKGPDSRGHDQKPARSWA